MTKQAQMMPDVTETLLRGRKEKVFICPKTLFNWKKKKKKIHFDLFCRKHAFNWYNVALPV